MTYNRTYHSYNKKFPKLSLLYEQALFFMRKDHKFHFQTMRGRYQTSLQSLQIPAPVFGAYRQEFFLSIFRSFGGVSPLPGPMEQSDFRSFS